MVCVVVLFLVKKFKMMLSLFVLLLYIEIKYLIKFIGLLKLKILLLLNSFNNFFEVVLFVFILFFFDILFVGIIIFLSFL